jgi:hypothetical protein
VDRFSLDRGEDLGKLPKSKPLAVGAKAFPSASTLHIRRHKLTINELIVRPADHLALIARLTALFALACRCC